MPSTPPGTGRGSRRTDSVAARSESTDQPKAHSSRTIQRFHVDPRDVGPLGFVEGGTLVEWIDTAACDTAARWSGRHCVAASVGSVHLARPIGVGDFVELDAAVVHTGRCSIHMLVVLRTGGTAIQTAQCPMVFIAVDDSGDPVDAPAWTPLTMLELQRHWQARVRIRMRTLVEDAMDAPHRTAGTTAPCATRHVLTDPADADGRGVVRAGRVMRWMDEAAQVCAADWTRAQVITSHLAGVRFHRPVAVGESVEITARILHTGPRSVHTVIHVAVDAGGRRRLVAYGVAVMVSLDAAGNAEPVRRWQPDSDEDRRLDERARQLIGLRPFTEPLTAAAPILGHCDGGWRRSRGNGEISSAATA